MKKMFLVVILAAMVAPVNKTFAAPDVRNFGKGVWIYYIRQCGTVDAIARRAEWAGLDYLIVKTHDGARWHQNWTSGKFQQLVERCNQRGVKVYAFGFNYGNHPEAEAKRVIESLGASNGYIYNVEGPFTRRRSAADIQQRAEAICKTVWEYRQRNCREKPLGYSTYCRIHLGAGRGMRNTGIFSVFGRYTDVAMPQAYWSVFRQTPKHTLWEMCQQWGAMEQGWYQAGNGDSAKPIIPTGVSYRPDISRSAVPVEQLVSFLEAAKGYYGINIYVWHEMSDAHWAALRSYKARPAPDGEPYEYKQPPTPADEAAWKVEEEEMKRAEPSNIKIIGLWCLKCYGILTIPILFFILGYNIMAKEERIRSPIRTGLLWLIPAMVAFVLGLAAIVLWLTPRASRLYRRIRSWKRTKL